MKMKCHGCGVEKDTSVQEMYPYSDDSIIDDEPIEPFFELDCQPWGIGDRVDDDWRRVRVCHECFHKLNPDMWISISCWEKLNPVIPFEKLPLLEDEE